jgi:hypothetical protein
MVINQLHFKNLQEAWQGINEYLFLRCRKIEKEGGGMYGTEWVSYNNFITIDRAIMNPNFDFGLTLGYTYKKWSMLVNNYVDIRYLDMLKAEINSRKMKKTKFYNYSFHFSNLHGGGKDCLVSMIFTKRVGIDHPVVHFTIRTSEVTKRLIFDFLLVQRICEYVYGHNKVEIHFFAPSFYITSESFVMYNNVKSIHGLLDEYCEEKNAKPHWFQTRTLEIFDKYYNHPDPNQVIYKVSRRSMMQIQKGKDGLPRSGVISCLAKELSLTKETIKFPEDVISRSQQKAYLKKL